MTDIVERLRSRKGFFSLDGGAHWLMSPELDSDCQEAANEIERLRKREQELQEYISENVP